MIPSVAITKALQSLQLAGGHAQGWRLGDTIKALVAANSDDGMTKLMVGDTQFTIRLPVPVKPGTTVTLVVRQNNEHGLVLEIKPPQGGATSVPISPLPTAQQSVGGEDQSSQNSQFALRGALDALVMDVLAKAQVLVAGTPLTTQANGAQVALAKIVNRRAVADPAAEFDDTTTEAMSADADSLTDGKMTPGLASHENTGAALTDKTNSPPAARVSLINFMVPDMSERVEIQVFKEDDQNHPPYSSDGTGRVFTARFTIASDTFGAVHAVLRQSGEAVSVSLWAERADVAADLQRDQGELRDGLHIADVEIEAIDVFAGNPPSGQTIAKRSHP